MKAAKSMKTFGALAWVFLTIYFITPPAYPQESDSVIDKFIQAQARKEEADEFPDARKILTGDLNNDGLADTAVLYTIEGQGGSNNYIQYLAVFLRTERGLVYATHRPIGGKNLREVELSSIANGVINLDTVNYGPRDPSCCPTLKGKTKFVFSRGRLNERANRR